MAQTLTLASAVAALVGAAAIGVGAWDALQDRSVRIVLARKTALRVPPYNYDDDFARFAGLVVQPICPRPDRRWSPAVMRECAQADDGRWRLTPRLGLRRGCDGRTVPVSEVRDAVAAAARSATVAVEGDHLVADGLRPDQLEQPLGWLGTSSATSPEGTGPFCVVDGPAPSGAMTEVVALHRRERSLFGANEILFYYGPENYLELVRAMNSELVHAAFGIRDSAAFGAAEKAMRTSTSVVSWAVEAYQQAILIAAVRPDHPQRTAVARGLRAAACQPTWLRHVRAGPAMQLLPATHPIYAWRDCPAVPSAATSTLAVQLTTNEGWADAAEGLRAVFPRLHVEALVPAQEAAKRSAGQYEVSLLAYRSDNLDPLKELTLGLRDSHWLTDNDLHALKTATTSAFPTWFPVWQAQVDYLVPMATFSQFRAINSRLRGTTNDGVTPEINLIPQTRTLVALGTGITLGATALLGFLLGRRIRRLDEIRERQQAQVEVLHHELTSPIAGIRHRVAELRATPRDKSEPIFAELDVELTHATDGLDQARDLADILMRRPRDPNPSLELGPLLDAAQQTLRTRARIEEVDLKFTITAPAEVRGALVPSLMRAVLRNLLDNAFKYRRSGQGVTCIELALDLGAEALTLDVTDHGIGVGDDLLLHRLGRRRDVRAREARQRANSPGIGLYIVTAQLDAVGGRLEVLRRRNPTTFRVTLPRRAIAVIGSTPDDPHGR